MERERGTRAAGRGSRKAALVALLALGAAFRAGAEGFTPDLTELCVNPGMLWILSTDQVGGAPAAADPLLTTLGFSLPWRFWDPFFAESMVDFWMTTYEYTASRAVPTGEETNKGFLVLAALLSLQVGNRWTVYDSPEKEEDGIVTAAATRLELGYALGADFLFRLPIDYNGGTASTADRAAGAAAAPSYFYGAGRFFYPETRAFLSWRLSPGFGITGSLRALWPLFHLWDGESGLEFWDQMQVAGNLGFTFYLK